MLVSQQLHLLFAASAHGLETDILHYVLSLTSIRPGTDDPLVAFSLDVEEAG
jgi:hypothetical protein